MFDAYRIPILSAMLWFPVLAAAITLPFALYQYHKYGALPWLRTLVVYSFVFYLMTTYFLVILPLPDKSDPSLFSLSRHFQPYPFNDLFNYAQNVGFPRTPGALYAFLRSFTFLQLAFNVLMTLPFGVYLRYYFKRSFLHTLCAGFLLSLFFELTQLSALYGFYPAPYRTFDADDLVCNTLGSVLGYLLAPGLLFFLPRRDEIDSSARRASVRVTFFRRACATITDLFLLYGAYAAVEIVLLVLCPALFKAQGSQFDIAATLFFVYLWLCSMLGHGTTPGKRLCHLCVADADGKPASKRRLTLRYVLLWVQLCGGTVFARATQALLSQGNGFVRTLLRFMNLALALACLYFFGEVLRKLFPHSRKTFRYEDLSGTHLISVFAVTDTPAQTL